MIRDKRWKYIHRYPYGPHELYDLERDPGERSNLIDNAGHSRTVESLRDALESWFAHYVDPAVDGVRQAVTGTGQVNLAGSANGGRLAFLQGQRLEKEADLARRKPAIP